MTANSTTAEQNQLQTESLPQPHHQEETQQEGFYEPGMLLQTVADQALGKGLTSFAMGAQLHCQAFCEKKSLEDAQEMADSNTQNLTKESIDALELQCNKICQRKFFKAYHFQHTLQTAPVEHRQQPTQQL